MELELKQGTDRRESHSPALTISGNGTSKIGVLYVVATPIGNLADVTLRALEVLKQVDTIACEDARRSLKFLTHYGIHKPVITVFGPKEKKESFKIVRLLLEGRSVALLSDAGTPSISDPGNFIVRTVRDEGLRIEPIPGVSAVACALSVSGCSDQGFIFLGFLKREKSKIKRMLLLANASRLPIIFFESPYRLLKTLEIASEIFGGSAFCWIGREMTKKFEEHFFGPLEKVLNQIKTREILGEITVILRPSIPSAENAHESGVNRYG